jgi:hypothetical protein
MAAPFSHASCILDGTISLYLAQTLATAFAN